MRVESPLQHAKENGQSEVFFWLLDANSKAKSRKTTFESQGLSNNQSELIWRWMTIGTPLSKAEVSFSLTMDFLKERYKGTKGKKIWNSKAIDFFEEFHC